MRPTLYDNTLSSECYKVRLGLALMGIEYDRVTVDIFPGKENTSAAFMACNPVGDVPVLVLGETTIRDAQAILATLAASHRGDGAWFARDADTFGAVMNWLMFAAGPLSAAGGARRHDLFGEPCDVPAVRDGAYTALRILDDRLTEQYLLGLRFLAADHPTIADIACFPDAALSGDGGIPHDDFPALRRWLLAMRRLPRFVTAPGVPEFS